MNQFVESKFSEMEGVQQCSISYSEDHEDSTSTVDVERNVFVFEQDKYTQCCCWLIIALNVSAKNQNELFFFQQFGMLKAEGDLLRALLKVEVFDWTDDASQQIVCDGFIIHCVEFKGYYEDEDSTNVESKTQN